MRSWWRHIVERGNQYFNHRWPILAFQPILFLFLWGAAVRLSMSPHTPPDFERIITDVSYRIWLGLGWACPPLALVSWWLIRHRDGLWRYRGMWFRLGADIGVTAYVLAFHLAVVLNVPATEARIFSRYTVGAVLVFLLMLVVRDVWALVLTESVARRIHRQGDK